MRQEVKPPSQFLNNSTMHGRWLSVMISDSQARGAPRIRLTANENAYALGHLDEGYSELCAIGAP